MRLKKRIGAAPTLGVAPIRFQAHVVHGLIGRLEPFGYLPWARLSWYSLAKRSCTSWGTCS